MKESKSIRIRKLGRTGVGVSELGFGTWQLGGVSWRAMRDSEALRLLKCARELGVSLFDVAPSYGNGRAEALVGKAFRHHRGSVFVSGKVGLVEDGTYRGEWSIKGLRRSIDASLRRLQTDYIDFLALHSPPMDVLKAGYAMEVLKGAKEMGKARFVGVSLEAQPVEAAIAISQGIDVLQVRLNLLYPEARSVFDLAAKKGIGVLCNSPLGYGYLSGRYASYADIPEGDFPRCKRSGKSIDMIDATITRANSYLKSVKGFRGNLAALALRYVLSHEVACAIAGHRSISELLDNARASRAPLLSSVLLRRITNLQMTKSSWRPASS